MNGKRPGAGGPRGGGEPSPRDAVAGRRTLPPGYGDGPGSRGRAFVNPYIERLAEYPDLILPGPEAEALRGRWRDVHGPPGPGLTRLEIGSGNGFFLRALCHRHPRDLCVGLEIRYKRVWMAARKLDRAGLANGRVVLHHAGYLERLFAPGEIGALYINHPDPWPKNRHARNRLFTPEFAGACSELLRRGGEVHVKSDFPAHADAARATFEAAGLVVTAFTPHLHAPGEPLAADNIVTNYERKAIAAGRPVFRLSLRRPS